MSRTIVQEYGPIYGEPVNGTVLGRPNGSVYVPLSNRISLTATTEYVTRQTFDWGKSYVLCSSDGTLDWTTYHYNAVAVSQDLSSNIQMLLYSDAELTTIVAQANIAAGNFNQISDLVKSVDYDTPQVGDTLYLVAKLMNSGSAVAATLALEVELV